MTKIRIPSWVSWVPDAEDLVLFDARDSSYHVLNWAASQIWRLLDGNSDTRQLAQKLASDHALSEGDAVESVDLFLRDALAKGLLLVE